MSERGSFVTSYIYCNECLTAVRSVLLGNKKYLCSRLIDSWEGTGNVLPIIAGKIGGGFPGEEVMAMEAYLTELAPKLCHSLHVAVIPDNGDLAFFNVNDGDIVMTHEMKWEKAGL